MSRTKKIDDFVSLGMTPIGEISFQTPTYFSIEMELDRLTEENKLLQKQLHEANEVIKLYAETTVGHKRKDGTYGMWLCSGEVAWENPLDRIKTRMDYICYDPRPAKKWLKKWGVR